MSVRFWIVLPVCLASIAATVLADGPVEATVKAEPKAKADSKAEAKPDAKKGQAAEGKTSKPAKALPTFTASREAAAMTFVAQNHPELRRLLRTLSESDQAAYQSAIRELFAESERLSDLQAKDAELYAVELERWKLGSRIKLMAARMQNGGTVDPDQEKRLKNSVRRSLEFELERRRLEVRRMEQALERQHRDVEELARTLDKRLESRMKSLLLPVKSAEGSGAAAPNADKPTEPAKDVNASTVKEEDK